MVFKYEKIEHKSKWIGTKNRYAKSWSEYDRWILNEILKELIRRT